MATVHDPGRCCVAKSTIIPYPGGCCTCVEDCELCFGLLEWARHTPRHNSIPLNQAGRLVGELAQGGEPRTVSCCRSLTLGSNGGRPMLNQRACLTLVVLSPKHKFHQALLLLSDVELGFATEQYNSSPPLACRNLAQLRNSDKNKTKFRQLGSPMAGVAGHQKNKL